MSDEDQFCPIWRTSARISNKHIPNDIVVSVDSPRAGGRYIMDGLASTTVSGEVDAVKARLTTWLVDQRRLGQEVPKIDRPTIEEAKLRRPLSIFDRADRFLRRIDDASERIGQPIIFTDNESSNSKKKLYFEILAHTESTSFEELNYLYRFLVNEGYFEDIRNAMDSRECQITPRGYMRLYELAKEVTLSTQAFVAMWFDALMSEPFERGIKPGILDAGYEPVRIDQTEHINKIDDQIIAEIRRSRFLVADFTQGETGARGGVYYEAGFAHGLDIPVFFTCKKEAISEVHFDTRQYNHILWSTPDELRYLLSQRISAVIGDGPLKKSV